MYQDRVVLCGASSYEKKYYLNEDFKALPQQIQDELERKAGYPISECQITDKNWEDLLRTNVIYGAVFKAAVRYTKDLQLTDKTLKYFYE